MNPDFQNTWVAFGAGRRIAAGTPPVVAAEAKAFVDAHAEVGLLVFDAVTSEPVELDLRGDVADVLARLAPADDPVPSAKAAPGRPRLGVVAREITLLPRQWEWLGSQPGGASATLRKLVEQAQRADGDKDRRRRAQESAYRFMTTMAGDEPGYEEATRALFAADLERLRSLTETWPADVREHALTLAAAAA